MNKLVRVVRGPQTLQVYLVCSIFREKVLFDQTCVLSVYSGSHVPRDASVIIAPPTAMGNVCSDWLRDMAGFVQIPPPDGQVPLH